MAKALYVHGPSVQASPARAASNTSRALWAAHGRWRFMLSANDYDADLAERYGWINRALPRRSTISSDRSRIGSPGFRRLATSWSRSASMRSRSRRPRTSAAIPISSVRASALPKPKSDSKPRSITAFRPASQKWPWARCWASWEIGDHTMSVCQLDRLLSRRMFDRALASAP